MASAESPEIRIRRLRMRSWRRGMKEMDLILGPFADGPLKDFGPEELDAYEALLEENDQSLYRWITGRLDTGRQDSSPVPLAAMIDLIAVHASGRFSAS